MGGELGGRDGLCGRTGRWIGFREIGMDVLEEDGDERGGERGWGVEEASRDPYSVQNYSI